MGVQPIRIERQFLLFLLCLFLAIPSELHSTLVEVAAHDVDGAVSVDARHADQKAHVEHSAIELHGRCPVCALPASAKALTGASEARPEPLRPAGRLTATAAVSLQPRLDAICRGRAPPRR